MSISQDKPPTTMKFDQILKTAFVKRSSTADLHKELMSEIIKG